MYFTDKYGVLLQPLVCLPLLSVAQQPPSAALHPQHYRRREHCNPVLPTTDHSMFHRVTRSAFYASYADNPIPRQYFKTGMLAHTRRSQIVRSPLEKNFSGVMSLDPRVPLFSLAWVLR
ncbi:unnamed protein product [Pieris brassicae]|uniref:Secreted protein n=1 Tax=Pieris brassicae TaxID=7116 RepID=A0A9P0TFS9_PIEBR|nr:unnamed protein product [Pieris brassicae]